MKAMKTSNLVETYAGQE